MRYALQPTAPFHRNALRAPATRPAVRLTAQDPANVPATQPAEHVVTAPNDLKWQPAPPSVPAGAQVAMLEGDIQSAGPFTMRVKFPAG